MFENAGEVVTHEIGRSEVETVSDLVMALQFAGSRSEARRLGAGGGVRLDGSVVADIMQPLACGIGSVLRVSVGKKRRATVRLV